jgi:hypothetical protein
MRAKKKEQPKRVKLIKEDKTFVYATPPKGTKGLFFKFETDDSGPLYWDLKNGKTVNFLDGDMTNSLTNKPFPEWFPLSAAKKFSKFFELPLETF